MCLILFGVTMCAVVAAALVSEQSTKKSREVCRQVDASYAQAAKLIQQMQELETRKQEMLVKAQNVSQLLERTPRSYLLGMVTNALPENASLTRLDLDVKRIVVAPPKDAKTKFEAKSAQAGKTGNTTVVLDIVGLAATDVDVARLIANLARNSLTGSVDLVYSQEKIIDKTPVREFQVHIELKPNADSLQALMPPESLAKAGNDKPKAFRTGVTE